MISANTADALNPCATNERKLMRDSPAIRCPRSIGTLS
jgi:hypothetical protein